MLTRRALLATLPLTAFTARASSSFARLLPLRHSSVLVEFGTRRVLIDPSLEDNFSAQGIVSVAPSARRATELGPLDVVVITSGEPWCFDPRTFAQLDIAKASVIVPDEDTAKRVRKFSNRVRVLRPLEATQVAGISVVASPARGVVADGIGVHVSSSGTALWHTGHVPPVDAFSRAIQFARQHRSDVVLGCAWGLALRAVGPAFFADSKDVLTLGELCGARAVIPLSLSTPQPAGMFSLAWRTPEAPPSSSPLLHVVSPGQWYRL